MASHCRPSLRTIAKTKGRSSLADTAPNDNAKEPSQAQPQPQRVPDPNLNAETPKSQFRKLSSLSSKSVLLYDWWLVRADGKGLAVAGFASGDLGVRAFSSANIAKRHDTSTLEAEDGITILISGFINRSRTHQNGFPLEVCKRFDIGFPYHWKEYAEQCYGQESADTGIPTVISCSVDNNMSSDDSHADTFESISLDDIPVTKIRDLLMSPQVDSALERKIFNEILGKLNGSNYVQDEDPSNHKKVKVDQKYEDDDRFVVERDIMTGEFKRVDNDILTSGRNVVTRSTARSMNIINKPEENSSSKSSVKHEIQSGGVVTRSGTDSNRVSCHHDKPEVRRSSRLKNP